MIFQDSSDDDSNKNDVQAEKNMRILIMQKNCKVSRDATRQFFKAFDDDDVKASPLESQWKKMPKRRCRHLYVEYKIQLSKRS